jgi:2-polyprenyl-6-methoxyphenol hydroxylase-like FAD-dependent oxidoreductase
VTDGPNDGESAPSATIVGGGLAGLCAGLALARVGCRVTIIERAAGEPPGGAGLGRVRRFLMDAAQAAPGIEITESVTVTGIREHDARGPVTLDSTAGPFTADIVVGADGCTR